MAVIKNINKDVYKRKLYKRVDFSIIDNQFNQWYSSTPSASRIFGWPQEEAQLRKTFEDRLSEDTNAHTAEMKRILDDFNAKYNGKQIPQNIRDEHNRQMSVKDNNFRVSTDKAREQYTSLTNQYSIKVFNPQSTSDNSKPTPTPTPVPAPAPAPAPAPPVISPTPTSLPDTPPFPTTTVIDPVNPSPSINNGAGPTSTSVGRSKDGRGDHRTHEEYNSDPVDNNNDTNLIKGITQMPTYAKIPLLCIIIIAIVAVVCAAIFVMRKRKKTREFNAEYGFKSNNFDSNNDFNMMTDNNRIITESIINEYAKECTQSEVQDYTNDDNQIENVETTSTNNVETTEEYINNQENYAFTPQYNVAYTTEMANNIYPEGAIQAQEPIDDQPISHYSPSLEGKELSIDDFIPLIQGR